MSVGLNSKAKCASTQTAWNSHCLSMTPHIAQNLSVTVKTWIFRRIRMDVYHKLYTTARVIQDHAKIACNVWMKEEASNQRENITTILDSNNSEMHINAIDVVPPSYNKVRYCRMIFWCFTAFNRNTCKLYCAVVLFCKKTVIETRLMRLTDNHVSLFAFLPCRASVGGVFLTGLLFDSFVISALMLFQNKTTKSLQSS